MPNSGCIKKIIAEFFIHIEHDEIIKNIKKVIDSDGIDETYRNSLKVALKQHYSKKEVNATGFSSLFNVDSLAVFDIVKFEKKIKSEDYHGAHYGPPKIISTIFSKGYESRLINFNNITNYAVMQIFKNETDWRVLEGDVINIKTISSTDRISFLGILNNPIHEYIFKSFIDNTSINITFLIELDPL